jgi:hypothetical protein
MKLPRFKESLMKLSDRQSTEINDGAPMLWALFARVVDAAIGSGPKHRAARKLHEENEALAV